MGFLAPLWLAALAALAVPIALHLWSRRPGRVVRVGSLRHLEGPPAESRRVRLHDPWLLALRLLLLGALALGLAAPFRTRERPRGAETWALVSPALLGDTAGRADRTLDSLRNAGTPIRLLAPGLPPLDDDASPPGDDGTPLWSLLREADHRAPAGARLLVVAPLRLRDAVGERPRLARAVDWRVAAPALADGDPASARGPVRSRAVSPRAVILAAEPRRDDARYLAAALAAVADVADTAAANGAEPLVLGVDSAPAVAARARAGDWIAWLADAPAPPALERAAERGAIVLADAPATATATAANASTAAAPQEVRVLAAGMPAVPARLRGRPPASGAALWADGAGRALLAARPVGAGLRLDFAGRFTPLATDLVLSSAFPELVARLGAAEDPARPAADARPITLAQILPASAPVTSTAAADAAAALERRDLGRPLLVLAALLFLFERLLVAWRDRRRAGTAT